MKKITFNAPLNHKAYSYEPMQIEVEKVIPLYGKRFEQMRDHPLEDAPEIIENKELMYMEGNTAHCILFLDANGNDGILVEAEGSDYARKSEFISNANDIDCHPAIIDRNTYNLVQQELARRNAKRKVSTKTVTEQGKYSSKYALTELMICGECGTPYRRCTWNVHGKKQIVWRCISRLDHGSKYCKSSPTIHEEPLHRAIIEAVNEFYDCGDDVAKILKANVESVLAGMEQSEIKKIEDRLKEIDKARNDMISLITSGSCDEDALDTEFAKLYEEETQLSGKLLSLKAQCKVSDDTKDKIESTIAEIENSRFQLDAFDDILIRKLIECVKVISKTEIIIIFKGGYEVKAEVEKK